MTEHKPRPMTVDETHRSAREMEREDAKRRAVASKLKCNCDVTYICDKHRLDPFSHDHE